MNDQKNLAIAVKISHNSLKKLKEMVYNLLARNEIALIVVEMTTVVFF